MNAHSDGELGLEASVALDEHIESCPGCRRALAGLQAVRGAIVRHSGTPRAPADLRASVEQATRPARNGRWATWVRSPLLVASPGLLALALAGWMLIAGAPRQAPSPRIVYHISESANARDALRNLSNHLRAAPGARVVVVVHNNGVDFVTTGARDAAGEPYESAIREYRRRGVEFRVCHNTLERRGIPESSLIPEVTLVPSGVAEIGRLQAEEGFAYMRL